jgi:hypothetical protein
VQLTADWQHPPTLRSAPHAINQACLPAIHVLLDNPDDFSWASPFRGDRPQPEQFDGAVGQALLAHQAGTMNRAGDTNHIEARGTQRDLQLEGVVEVRRQERDRRARA